MPSQNDIPGPGDVALLTLYVSRCLHNHQASLRQSPCLSQLFEGCLIRLLISGRRLRQPSRLHNKHKRKSVQRPHHVDNSTTPFRFSLHRNHPADPSRTINSTLDKRDSRNHPQIQEMRSVTCLLPRSMAMLPVETQIG